MSIAYMRLKHLHAFVSTIHTSCMSLQICLSPEVSATRSLEWWPADSDAIAEHYRSRCPCAAQSYYRLAFDEPT